MCNTSTTKISQIPTDLLFPNPRNRMDLGDLSELTASIRENGILQNLIVVKYNETIHGEIPGISDSENAYVVVAGGRRLACAKALGLSDVPCKIADISDLGSEMSMNIGENATRKSFNPSEESELFQLALFDFGESAESISKATGISDEKVRKHSRLGDMFKNNQVPDVPDASMEDLLSVQEIDDDSLRQRVMRSVGTSNFQWELNRAKVVEQNRKDLEQIIPEVKKFATPVSSAPDGKVDWSKYTTDAVITGKANFTVPENPAEPGEYLYEESDGAVSIYRRLPDSEIDASAKKREERTRLSAEYSSKIMQLREIEDTARQSRAKFVADLSPAVCDAHFSAIFSCFTRFLFSLPHHAYFPTVDAKKVADRLNAAVVVADDGGKTAPSGVADWENVCKRSPGKTLLTLTHMLVDENYSGATYVDTKTAKPSGCSVSTRVPFHVECNTLDMMYNMLSQLGYAENDSERTLRDGSSELYYHRSKHNA